MLTLKGKVAIVTGGGTGIGRAIALALAEEQVRVVVCGRRREPLVETAAEIEARGGAALALTADISQEEEVARLVNQAGPADILINNAAMGGGKYLHEVTVEEWDKMMAVNVRGPFLMARAVLPSMRQRKQGHIINISSEVAVGYYAGSGAYGVSKHALNALGEVMQRENRAFGVHVNTICPGLVATEALPGNPYLDRANCLQPADIADVVIWLLTAPEVVQPIVLQSMASPWRGRGGAK